MYVVMRAVLQEMELEEHEKAYGEYLEVVCLSPPLPPSLSSFLSFNRGTSLVQKRIPIGPYGRPIPRAL